MFTATRSSERMTSPYVFTTCDKESTVTSLLVVMNRTAYLLLFPTFELSTEMFICACRITRRGQLTLPRLHGNRLILFREMIAVYCENHTEHTNTLCGQHAEFCNVEAAGTYIYHCPLKGKSA
jgi:hypothetical protein